MTIFVLFSFFLLRNISGTYSKYFQNNITKLIVDLSLCNQLCYVPLQDVYVYSTYVIDLCIQNNFKVFLSSLQFLVRHACVSKVNFKKFLSFKKNKFCLLLRVNRLFMCKQFLLAWGYFCSELIILILVLVTFMSASFSIDLFNWRFEFFRLLLTLGGLSSRSFTSLFARILN